MEKKEKRKLPKYYVVVAVKEDDPNDVLALADSITYNSRMAWSRSKVHLEMATDYYHNGYRKAVQKDIDSSIEFQKKEYDKDNKHDGTDDPKWIKKKKELKHMLRDWKIRSFKHHSFFARTGFETCYKRAFDDARKFGRKIRKHGYKVFVCRLNSKHCPIQIDMGELLKGKTSEFTVKKAN